MSVESLEVGALRFHGNEATLCGCGDLSGRTGNRSRLVVGVAAEGQESVFGSESLEWEGSWESRAFSPTGRGNKQLVGLRSRLLGEMLWSQLKELPPI